MDYSERSRPDLMWTKVGYSGLRLPPLYLNDLVLTLRGYLINLILFIR